MSITIDLMGGCGNQIFQYAMGRAQAARLGTDVKLSMTWYNTGWKSLGWKPFCLDQFVGVTEEQVSDCSATVVERTLEYDSTIWSRITKDSCLRGYWLSENYFLSIAETLRRDLQPKVISDAARSLAEKIESAGERSAFIGFRRGDFAVAGVNLSMGYYQKAIEKVIAVQSDPHFFLFADDGDWVRNNFEIPFQTTIASVHNNEIRAGNGHEAEDIWLMSQCRHAIIPNSSFSWWGAWLNPDANRVVVIPQPWHQEEQNYSLVPDRWRAYTVHNDRRRRNHEIFNHHSDDCPTESAAIM